MARPTKAQTQVH